MTAVQVFTYGKRKRSSVHQMEPVLCDCDVDDVRKVKEGKELQRNAHMPGFGMSGFRGGTDCVIHVIRKSSGC